MTGVPRTGGALTGIERLAVHNALRAAFGARWEIPFLLDEITLPARAVCLEVGAGLGWGTLGLVRRLRPWLVVATDLDETVLPRTRRYLAERGVGSSVRLMGADAKRLPFGDATFDLVLALYVLHHALGYRPVIADVARVLKPGAVFALIDPVRPRWLPNFRRLAPPDGLATRDELREHLEALGLRVARWRGMPVLAYMIARKEAA